MPIVIPKRCTQAQRKYLTERIGGIRAPYRYGHRNHPKEPEGIRIARLQIRQYESQLNKTEETANAKYHKALKVVTAAIQFSGPDEALAAVEIFEKAFPTN